MRRRGKPRQLTSTGTSMAKPFNVETKESRFRLPRQTLKEIAALMSDLDQDARSIVIVAVAQLHQREIQNDRDIFAELDAIRVKLGMNDDT